MADLYSVILFIIGIYNLNPKAWNARSPNEREGQIKPSHKSVLELWSYSRGWSRVSNDCMMKYVKNVDHQISEAKSAIVGVFLGNVALLGWISTIIDFVVLCTPCVYMVNVPLVEKPDCWFALTKYVITVIGRVRARSLTSVITWNVTL